jgi:hypothetical protein
MSVCAPFPWAVELAARPATSATIAGNRGAAMRDAPSPARFTPPATKPVTVTPAPGSGQRPARVQAPAGTHKGRRQSMPRAGCRALGACSPTSSSIEVSSRVRFGRWFAAENAVNQRCQILTRHARPCAGHPRLSSSDVTASKTWMAGTSPAMTGRRPDNALTQPAFAVERAHQLIGRVADVVAAAARSGR